MEYLTLTKAEHLSELINYRIGEIKIGERFALLKRFSPQQLKLAKDAGCRFAILGIAEDLGPRANLGQGGANKSFTAAIKTLANMQSNRFFDGKECLLVGQIQTQNLLHADTTEELRQAVSELDKRVIKVCREIIAAGLEPIVIGGGHNNAYGLINAVYQATNTPVAAVNQDFHCDFRLQEGRHSGNGFSYAAVSGALEHYHILGLHEQKNTEQSLEQLQVFGGTWHSFQDIWLRRNLSLSDALKEISTALNQIKLPVGLELDLDTIAEMPSSAMTFAGIPLLDACHYVQYIARHNLCHYLHLAEAAPNRHDAGIKAGFRVTGQAIAELILSYIDGRQRAVRTI